MFYIDNDDIFFDESFFEVGNNFVLQFYKFPFDKVFGCIVAGVVHVFKEAFEDIDFEG